jgi:hypothetical protein
LQIALGIIPHGGKHRQNRHILSSQSLLNTT